MAAVTPVGGRIRSGLLGIGRVTLVLNMLYSPTLVIFLPMQIHAEMFLSGDSSARTSAVARATR